MTTASSRAAIDDFFESGSFAIAGVSPGGKKFGNYVLKELSAAGYTLYPLHPTAESIDGHKCHHGFASVPEGTKSLILSVKPERAGGIIKEAARHGFTKVWFQQGSSDPELLKLAAGLGFRLVHDQCILMYNPNIKFPHTLHKFIWKLIGKYPK